MYEQPDLLCSCNKSVQARGERPHWWRLCAKECWGGRSSATPATLVSPLIGAFKGRINAGGRINLNTEPWHHPLAGSLSSDLRVTSAQLSRGKSDIQPIAMWFICTGSAPRRVVIIDQFLWLHLRAREGEGKTEKQIKAKIPTRAHPTGLRKKSRNLCYIRYSDRNARSMHSNNYRACLYDTCKSRRSAAADKCVWRTPRSKSKRIYALECSPW